MPMKASIITSIRAVLTMLSLPLNAATYNDASSDFTGGNNDLDISSHR
jgi:hypothetical protein